MAGRGHGAAASKAGAHLRASRGSSMGGPDVWSWEAPSRLPLLAPLTLPSGPCSSPLPGPSVSWPGRPGAGPGAAAAPSAAVSAGELAAAREPGFCEEEKHVRVGVHGRVLACCECPKLSALAIVCVRAHAQMHVCVHVQP